MNLFDILESIRTDGDIQEYNETQICHFVLEILNTLGWSSLARSNVYSQYPIQGEFIDYCLAYLDKNKVFIEVKRPRARLDDHEQQLLNYSFKEGVRIAVLTNGIEWRLYLPLSYGSWSDRMFYKSAIGSTSTQDIATDLTLFMSKNTVLSGEAYADASTRLERRRAELETKQAIPKAWKQILRVPDSRLIDLLSIATNEITGYLPSTEQVSRFLRELSQPNTQPIASAAVKPMVSSHVTVDKGSRHSQKTVKTQHSIQIGDLLAHRLITPGQKIFFEHRGTRHSAKIDSSGHVVFQDGATFTSLSSAGRHITKSSTNGWVTFFTITGDNRVVMLEELRRQLETQ